MAETIKLAGADGFEFCAYHEPAFTPRKGGVIVIQEIFGLDVHVRADVERWAKMGYEAIAPSLYDRREPGFTTGHDPEGLQAGIAHARATPLEQALLAATQRPMAAACISVPVPRPLWMDRPSWFFVAEEDRIIPAETQRFMAARMNARVRAHAADHAPLVTAPQLVADIIREAISSI